MTPCFTTHFEWEDVRNDERIGNTYQAKQSIF
jgi:hypothetical protein